MSLRLDIVPVLDLKGGQVVHARAGKRDRYLPIRSSLAQGSAPDAILDGLLALAPFRSVYIADLDAIEGQGNHRALIARLATEHRGLEFWVDGGFTSLDAADRMARVGATPVLGSESWQDAAALAAAVAALGRQHCVLSLDYRGERFVGPPGFESRPDAWPDRVIAMTLAKVGTGSGPDVARLANLSAAAGPRRLFAAGGVRGLDDLRDLAARDIAGALVATALHDGRLSSAALAEFAAD